VRAGAERLAALGAVVSEVSSPCTRSWRDHVRHDPVHREFGPHTDGFGIGREDVMVPGFLEVQGRWRERPNDLPVTLQNSLLLASSFGASAVTWSTRKP